MAVDAGFANVGVVVMSHCSAGWVPVDAACIQTEKSDRRLKISKPDDYARRIGQATREIAAMIRKHGISGMVIELPPGGGARIATVKMLSLAAGMIVAIPECFGIPAEFYNPEDTRRAAGVPSTTKDRDHVKEIVMEAMGAKYPSVRSVFTSKDRFNHVADALATFEAGRNGVLVRTMESLGAGVAA